MNWKAWILATRPKTLSAASVPVAMATALAHGRSVAFPLWVPLCALLGALLIQVATNFMNDALDFRKGADTGERLGPVRVTQAGLLSADAVMRGAFLSLFLAALCGIPLLYRGGWPLLAIGLSSMVLAYAYTGGPLPLAYHGLGELFVMLFFGVIAVGGTYYVLALNVDSSVLLAGVAAGSLATVLLVINNLRDVDTDVKSRKRTLAVRLGERFARAEVVFFVLLPFAVSAVLGVRHPMFLLTALALVPAVAVVRIALRSHGRELNRALALSGALQWSYGILFVAGAIL